MKVLVGITAALLMVYLCGCGRNEPLPIGSSVRFSKSAPCAPTEYGLEEVRKAEQRGEQEFYRAMDRIQAVELKAGEVGSVISATVDNVRVRLPAGSVNRLTDNTCWISLEAIAR